MPVLTNTHLAVENWPAVLQLDGKRAPAPSTAGPESAEADSRQGRRTRFRKLPNPPRRKPSWKISQLALSESRRISPASRSMKLDTSHTRMSFSLHSSNCSTGSLPRRSRTATTISSTRCRDGEIRAGRLPEAGTRPVGTDAPVAAHRRRLGKIADQMKPFAARRSHRSAARFPARARRCRAPVRGAGNDRKTSSETGTDARP